MSSTRVLDGVAARARWGASGRGVSVPPIRTSFSDLLTASSNILQALRFASAGKVDEDSRNRPPAYVYLPSSGEGGRRRRRNGANGARERERERETASLIASGAHPPAFQHRQDDEGIRAQCGRWRCSDLSLLERNCSEFIK